VLNHEHVAINLPGAIQGGGESVWNKYTITWENAAFKANAAAVSVALALLPANTVVEAIKVKQSVAFAGTGISSVTMSLGDGSAHTAYTTAHNVLTAVSATAHQLTSGPKSATSAAHTLTARFTGNVAVGDDTDTVLTAGSVTIWVKTSILR
jgi:hypothetical protein